MRNPLKNLFSGEVLAESERHELAAQSTSIYVKEQLKLTGKK